MSARARRADALPEYHEYADTGCDYAPRCLRCPFAVCRYDRGGSQMRVGERKHPMIVELHTAGMDPSAIAAAAGVSRRTVFRRLQLAAGVANGT